MPLGTRGDISCCRVDAVHPGMLATCVADPSAARRVYWSRSSAPPWCDHMRRLRVWSMFPRCASRLPTYGGRARSWRHAWTATAFLLLRTIYTRSYIADAPGDHTHLTISGRPSGAPHCRHATARPGRRGVWLSLCCRRTEHYPFRVAPNHGIRAALSSRHPALGSRPATRPPRPAPGPDRRQRTFPVRCLYILVYIVHVGRVSTRSLRAIYGTKTLVLVPSAVYTAVMLYLDG